MKKINYIPVLIAATIALSCTKTQFDEFEATTGGTANFTTYISVGNSLTQGYQDGGLHNEYNQQSSSYPSIIAKQMGVSFVQPMVDGEGSGHKFLAALAASPTITDVAPDANWSAAGWSTWDKNKQYNNLGVAGIRLTDCVPPFNPIHNIINGLNPFGAYQNLQTNSYLDNVKASNATFFTCWLGNNDVLGWSTNGGNDTVTIPGLGSVNTSAMTPVAEFRNKYDSILDAFSAMGAKGVCATLPDVTAIPFFTTVPHNPIPLDAATASSLMAGGYDSYNAGLDGLATAGMITAAEAAQRKIVFTASETNAIVIMDESLTDLTGVNPALINMRQATAVDLILLTASSDIGRVFSATQIYGVSVPFADSLVLTATEVIEVTNHTALLNNEIRTSAAAHGVAVVDMHAFMVELQAGMAFDGVDFSASYIEGGAFSLDGVHPNSRGYAIIANKFMEVINDNYGANLRPVIVHDYKGIIFP